MGKKINISRLDSKKHNACKKISVKLWEIGQMC